MRLNVYGGLSTGLSLALIAHAFLSRDFHFFASCVHLTKSPASVLVLLNWALYIAILFGQVSQRLFFGELRAIEVEHLYERAWLAVMDTCLSMTIFKDEFDLKFIFLFASLLYLKSFHWIVADRVDFMEQMTDLNATFHIRMASILSLLSLVDAIFLTVAVTSILTKSPDMMLVFAFELTMLLSMMIATAGKYALHTVDLRSENPWEEKSQYIFYIELVTDFLKLLVFIAFFVMVILHYGLPIHIIRDLYITLRSFVTKCTDLYKYRLATANMRARYPTATQQELDDTDRLCIICREEMELPPADQLETSPLVPKKLGCGHIFHFRCLRSWLERQQACPTCRRSVLDQPTPPPVPAADEDPLNGALAANVPPPIDNGGLGRDPHQQQPPAPEGPLGGLPRIPQFSSMNDFLQHIGQLTGTARQPQITRITPLVPSPAVTPLDLHTAPLPPLNEEQLLQIQQDPRQAIDQRIRTMELLQRQMTETLSQLRQISAVLPSTSRTVDTGPAVTSDLGGPSSGGLGVETTHHGTGGESFSSGSGQSSSADKGKGKAREIPNIE